MLVFSYQARSSPSMQSFFTLSILALSAGDKDPLSFCPGRIHPEGGHQWASTGLLRQVTGNKRAGAVTLTFSISRAGRTNLHCVWRSLSLQSECTKMTLFYLKLTSETALGIMTPNRTSQLVAQTKFSPTETRSLHRKTNGSICKGQGRCKSILDFLYMLPTKKKNQATKTSLS